MEPYMIDLRRFIDDRGMLDQIYEDTGTFEDDVPFPIKRIYFTKTYRGTIRGMHGHKEEWKAFYVTKGMIKIVAYPMALTVPESSIVGGNLTKQLTFTLSDMKPQILIIPPNCYHGYMPLTDKARVLILSNATLKESQEDDYRIAPIEELFKVENR